MAEDADAQMREVLSRVGSVMTPKKREAQSQNIRGFNAQPRTEEYLAKLRAAQKARRDRERAEREQAQAGQPPSEARGPGRPSTRPKPDPDAPKRPRGRPKSKTPADNTQNGREA